MEIKDFVNVNSLDKKCFTFVSKQILKFLAAGNLPINLEVYFRIKPSGFSYSGNQLFPGTYENHGKCHLWYLS